MTSVGMGFREQEVGKLLEKTAAAEPGTTHPCADFPLHQTAKPS
jgi:hypothetical protein